MSIISNEHQSGSPFDRDEDTKPREPGCKCHWEEGDSPCPVHGENEEGSIATEHQPGSPVAVDLDALDRLHSENLNLLDFDLAMHRRWPALSAELRTLRARVGELERAYQGACARSDAHARDADSAEARVNKLEKSVGYHDEALNKACGQRDAAEARITDLESQLAAAREEQGLPAQIIEALGARHAEHSFQVRKHGIEPWMAVVRDRDGKEQVYEGATLPALLRAILEVEAKGA